MGSVMRGLLRNTIIIGLFVLYFIMILVKSDLGGNLLSPVVTAIAAWYLYLGYVKKAAGRTMRAEGVFFLRVFLHGWSVIQPGRYIVCSLELIRKR